MPAAPRPSFEHDRLKALHAMEILESSASPQLHSILRSLAKLLRCPTVIVSIVADETQLFISKFGTILTGSPREYSFCAHTILYPTEVMKVSDASADERFSDNPFVTGAPYIKSYAGAPLLQKDGLPIGALCLIDDKVRTYTEYEEATLKNASRVVSAMLSLHRAKYMRPSSAPYLS